MSESILTHRLFAKSRRGGREITLCDHLQDTAAAARLIFSSDYRVGRNFQKAFKLNEDEREQFLLNLVIACLFHDIGKANEGFANAIKHKRNSQVIRHEHLSALVLQLPAIKSWLGGNSALRHPVILAAVLSHHLKAEYGKIGAIPIGGPKICELFFNHSEIRAILADVSSTAGLVSAPTLTYSVFSNNEEPWKSLIKQIEQEGNSFRRTLNEPEDIQGRSDRKLLAALKSALIISDSVASAIVREGGSIEDWINENLHVDTLTSTDLSRKIIIPCTAAIQKRCGKPYEPARFQVAASELGSKSVLRAGCGSGKTLAAYYWAAKQLDKGEYGRVLFLYPTRGTATEGFKDYTGWAPDGESLLLHGTSKYTLESMLENPPESAEGKNYLDESSDRLYTLANFNRRFFSATVDQFLSFLQFNYSSICMSVILADSVVVLDEIHSFDRRLFNTVLEFLKSMNVPTLCMTATLPQSRVKQLSDLGLDFFPREKDMVDLGDLAHAEGRLRYQIQCLSNELEALKNCREAMMRGEKVLWVVNTVDRCQRLSAILKRESIGHVICYHSRFKLEDREKQHKACVEQFRPGSFSDSGLVAITTQVCEMSLDLDADRLITEVAPVSSLIQRMGRANRHPGTRPSEFRATVQVYAAESAQPYQKDSLQEACRFVDWLIESGRNGISQALLAEGMDKFSVSAERDLGPSAKLFDSGYFATPAEVREIDDFTVPAILDSDLIQAENLVRAQKGIESLVLPIPRKFVLDDHLPSWMPRYLNVAKSKLYDTALGFRTQNWEVG